MMVNTETVAFIGLLNKLAEDSKYGIRPFSTVTKQDTKGLLYDDQNPISSIFSSHPFCPSVYSTHPLYPLISSYSIDENHHDIIATWTDGWKEDGIQIAVTVDCDGACVEVSFKDDPDLDIIVNNGAWFVNFGH